MPEPDQIDPTPPRRRITSQFIRYICVGGFNTLFGYSTYVLALALLNRVMPGRYLYLTVMLASVLTTPVNITVAYFGYKFFVFRTRGNHLREWLKAFAVYGTSMLIGLAALSGLTRFLQHLLHDHADAVASMSFEVGRHLSGSWSRGIQQLTRSSAFPGYVAGAVITALTTIYSFIGHRHFTFRPKRTARLSSST